MCLINNNVLESWMLQIKDAVEVLRCPPNIINLYIVMCSIVMYTMSSSTMTIQHKSELTNSDYSKQSGKSLLIADFFNAISDDKSMTIFNTAALNAGKTGILISTLGITRKQFYSKMERFIKLGLLVRREGNYYLTSLGKIMYQLQGIFGLALNNYWKSQGHRFFANSSRPP